MLGDSDGVQLGIFVGFVVGTDEGRLVTGCSDVVWAGSLVGSTDGFSLGYVEGDSVGCTVGTHVGVRLGNVVGTQDGAALGN